MQLYRDPHFVFRFTDARVIPRLHLDGVGAGRRVTVFAFDFDAGERRELPATAVAG